MMQIHKPLLSPQPQSTEQANTIAQSKSDANYKLSEKELNKLSGREAKQEAEKEANSDMPDHIAKMIEQLKKIKEQIEQQKEQLVKLKALDNQQDEAVKAQVEAQTNMIVSMQAQMGSLVQTIAEAMKEAGVTDTGSLVSAMV